MKANNENIEHHELLVKYLAAEATLEEIRQAEQWIDMDAANREYYEHLKFIWTQSKGLAKPTTINKEQSWNDFKEKLQTGYFESPEPGRNLLWLKVAAVVLLVSGAIWASFNLGKSDGVRNSSPAVAEGQYSFKKTVTGNNTKADTLPDGSVITLNKNSDIRYPASFNGATRNVELNGEAFFDIKHNAAKPFVLQVNQFLITVLGTSFNVNSNGSETEIIVATGRVSVRRKQEQVMLNAGEKLTVGGNATALKKEVNTDDLYRYYLDSATTVKQVSLKRFVTVLNHAYNADIIIAQPQLNVLPATLKFSRSQPLTAILTTLSNNLGLTVNHKGSVIILSKTNKADTTFDINKYPDLLKKILKDPNKWPGLLKNYTPKKDTTAAGKDRAVVRNIIHDLILEKIVADGGVKSFRLNDSVFKVNDNKQPEAIHRRFKAKYIKEPGFTIYLGGSPAAGKGIFVKPENL